MSADKITVEDHLLLLALFAESTTVMVELLAEDETLVSMIKAGKSQEECLAYINENY